ncbi:leucyl-tRNA synthetase, partial [Massariosphaeria phaeospora]
MFPYPSGTLHLGHLRVYTIADVLARFKHLDGFRVLHPIGWDAFGLPAENAALERGVQPGAWTRQNIAAMKAQMRAMGGQWDWDRELRTCDPAVYQHTQRLFLLLHARGLAYQAEALVNYDPVDKTVLANEQVDAHGCSWRSGAKVEKLLLKQWFLKIKHFQDALLHDLDALAESGRWPERVISMQRNWIGRSEGMKLCFDIQTGDAGESQHDPLEVFTTRADTLFGVHYVALSLHHPLVQAAAKHDDALKAFRQRAHHLPPDSKEGYLLPNLQAINPLFDVSRSEDGGRLVPIYVAPYVLEDYGSGAVMGVPGHDTRDHAFWRANTDARPIRTVITTEPGVSSGSLIPGQDGDRPVTAKGFMATDIDGFADLPSDEAAQRIASRLQQSGKPVEKTVNWRLRDWLISRQRYWGTPIPIIHCNTCGPVPVPVADLPVELPQLPDASFRGRTGNPLADDETWKKTTCPKCGEAAERETDTMDTFMDSSWYFFRFLDPQNSTSLVSPDKANRGMPVDVYVGGVEHAILHLLYARFISKFLATTPLWPAGRLVHGEPFKHLLTQGMVHGKTYSDPDTRRFLRPEEVDLTNPSAPTMRPHGQPCTVSFEKMSKSKHNGVDPGETIARYGADVTRAHMLFQAPVSAVLEWDETSITGVQRWLVRVIRLSKATFVTPEDHSRGFRPPKNIDMSLTDLLWWLHEEGLIKHKMSMDQDFNTLKLAWVQKLPDGERYLWGQLQNIITSVRQSYSETHSLNTVVSHLMTLTNIIWDTAHTSLHVAYLKWFATVHLLRMVAPIAPAVAEEGWKNIHTATSARINQIVDHPLRDCGRPSVFAFGFPIADGNTSSKLRLFTTCVFQINGKKRFEKVLEAIVATDTGSEWLEVGTGKLWKAFETSEPHPFYGLIPKDFKLIVVKRGQVVNVVSPNISKEDRKKAREEKMAQRRAKKQV